MPSVAFECVLFGLAVHVCFKEYQDSHTIRLKGLLRLLVRDSFLYFFM